MVGDSSPVQDAEDSSQAAWGEGSVTHGQSDGQHLSDQTPPQQSPEKGHPLLIYVHSNIPRLHLGYLHTLPWN